MALGFLTLLKGYTVAMRTKLVGLMVAILATLSVQQPGRLAAQQPARAGAAPALPPLVYVCTMAGDEDVLEEKPGRCPKCGMELQPVRLDSKFWCPTHQTLVVRDGPGTCPLDGKELVQVTLSETWHCADNPDQKLLEPGRCADGKARTIKYEVRAHGDHNPKHGGMFFMASDAWHHIEGTLPSADLFRVYFYDNFSKPMSVSGFTGSLVLLDAANKEIASYPLRAGRDGRTMEARIPAANARLPLNAAARITFKAGDKDNFFNFPFSKLTAEPAGTPAATTTSAAPRPGTPRPAAPATASAAPASRPPAATPALATPPPAPAAPPTQAAAQELTPLVLDSPLNMPPGLAEATDESRLPTNTAGLVAELDSRAGEVAKLVAAGELGQVWLPAMGTKTVALVLDTHVSSLPERQRAAASLAVKQIVMASWDIDNYGDLGNLQKITEAYQRLASAVQNLKALYAQ